MALKIFNIEDEMTPVMTFIHLKSGNYMAIPMSAKQARTAIYEWRKAMLHFSLTSVEDQKKNLQDLESKGEKEPYFLYYFMEGFPDKPETHKPCACVMLPSVSGIHFQPIEDNEISKELMKNQSELIKVLRQLVREEIKGDEWKHDCNGDEN